MKIQAVESLHANVGFSKMFALFHSLNDIFAPPERKKRNFQYNHDSLNCQFRQVLSTRNILFDDLYHSYNRYRHSDYKYNCFQTNLAEERAPHDTAILCLGICFHNTRRELNTVPTVEYYLMPFYKRTLTEMVPFHKHKPKI